LTSWDKTFQWTGNAGATWYILNVRNASNALIKNIWVSAADAQCASDTSCSFIIPNFNLANGSYSWRVLNYGGYGYGLWSAYTPFTLNISPLSVPLSPINTMTSWDKSYQWTGNAGATWYILNVRNSSDVLIKNIWVSAADAQCASDTSCTYVIPGMNLANGSYSWRVLNYSPSGYGTWSAYTPFTLSIAPMSTLISPLGTVTGWDNTFQWTGNTGATYYIINVRNASDVLIKNIWVSAADAQCASDTSCTYIIPNFNLANGSYSWRVLNYSPSGYGAWTAYQAFLLQ
jgi:CubicO group peptidase (beta-lactamase class C family)